MYRRPIVSSLLFFSCFLVPGIVLLGREPNDKRVGRVGSPDDKKRTSIDSNSATESCRLIIKLCDKEYLYAGPPVMLRSGMKTRILLNQGYIAAFSEDLKVPLWVAYRIDSKIGFDYERRKGRFIIDRRITVSLNHSDYTRSGYSRGHMAPAYAIYTRFGKEAARETFYMTNIVPQVQALNGGLWKEVEMNVAGKYARERKELWILAGPVFDDKPERLSSGVEIPDGFFKIILDDQADGPSIISYFFPNEDTGSQKTRNFLTSVDNVEQMTGIDFFSLLDDTTEKHLEALQPLQEW